MHNFLTAEYDYDMDIKMKSQERYNDGVQRGMRRGMRRGMQRGIQQGEVRGIQTERNNTARRMKEANCNVAFIQQITGLSKEEIEKL